MRKLVVAISVIALPLAACGEKTETPPEVDPIEQVIDEPVPPVEGDTTTPLTEDGTTVEDTTADDTATNEKVAETTTTE